MRIGGGEYRGRILQTPRGEKTRPTSGIVRETLFNILAPELAEARVLDLFAGCGSVGLEALGRGAVHATLVENARAAVQCLRANIAMLGVEEQASVLPYTADRALKYLAQQAEQFDIVFLDPPFADVQAYQDVLATIASTNLLAPDGILIAQHDARVALPDSAGPLTRCRLRQIGDNALSFYRRA
ncbi:MAG: 16S rRNA (guanine(966)-N(2))-methyltransferase RsmD [Armatimonadota bacterium]